MRFDYVIKEQGTDQEHDVMTVDGHEFVEIRHSGRGYDVVPLVGSQKGTVFRSRGSHHAAFEDGMLYAAIEKLAEQFASGQLP